LTGAILSVSSFSVPKGAYFTEVKHRTGGGVFFVPKVTLKNNESVEKALRRLKKKMDKEGTIKQLREHRHYEKPSDKRRRLRKGRRY